MPQKRSTQIVEKALKLFKISIFMQKMETSVVPKLIFFKKARKHGDDENSKLLIKRRYNKNSSSSGSYYAFLKEFEFSPSSTPLFQRHRRAFKKRSRRYLCSVIFLCRRNSGVNLIAEREEHEEEKLEGGFKESPECSDFGGDEDDSVDRRAEVFIHRFYEEMRIQRQDSDLQIDLGGN